MMKKLLLLTLATWACTAIGAAAQGLISPEPPVKLLPGTVFQVTEKSWVITDARMRKYNELHLGNQLLDGSDVTALMVAYDRASKTDSLAYSQLLDVATKGNAELRALLNSQRQSIMLAQANSQAVLLQNDQLLADIKELKKDIQKSNRGRTWRTIGWVLSAAAAGFLAAQL